jgi:hypothetical protein
VQSVAKAQVVLAMVQSWSRCSLPPVPPKLRAGWEQGG